MDRQDQLESDHAGLQADHFMRRLMRGLARWLPANEGGENASAVTLFHRVEAVRELLSANPVRRGLRRLSGKRVWPVTSGAYLVKDQTAPVAVCVLTSNDLLEPVAALPQVAIAGRVYTANLGLEKIILNVTANPAIRFLLLCGRESTLFHPGQSLQALAQYGVTSDRQIINASGYFPVLRNVASERIALFRRQVEVVDCAGERDLAVLEAHINALAARSPGPLAESRADGQNALPGPVASAAEAEDRFTLIRPGGSREPLRYDPNGFFVITVDHATREILIRHYLPDQTPQYKLCGHSAEALLLGLLQAGLVSQLSHAGYLGAELAKAETALRLNFRYEQDQPLRRR